MDTIVSMNFWGFHPNIFPALAKEFELFITENKENQKLIKEKYNFQKDVHSKKFVPKGKGSNF